MYCLFCLGRIHCAVGMSVQSESDNVAAGQQYSTMFIMLQFITAAGIQSSRISLSL